MVIELVEPFCLGLFCILTNINKDSNVHMNTKYISKTTYGENNQLLLRQKNHLSLRDKKVSKKVPMGKKTKMHQKWREKREAILFCT